ncbi:glycosyl hydrolase family 95 catalytic domain-containing protein [Actinoallomurus acanthiterrae]
MSSPSRRTFLRTTAIGSTAIGTTALGSATADALPTGSTTAAASAPRGMRTEREWAAFLAGSDLSWKRMPGTFYEGPFLGNGAFGAAAYRHPTRQRLTFELGDSRVRDHQDGVGALFGHSRLRIGYLTLETTGDVTGVDLRLSLWDAELSGTITTTAGTVTLRSFVHATRDLLVIDAAPTGGETVAWSFTPFPAVSPRLASKPRPAGLKDNPDPVLAADHCDQDLVAGGRTTTAWHVDGHTLLATVAHTFPDRTATEVAAQRLKRAAPLDELTREHRRWWHRFYPKSFLSLPDARLQAFYWIQLYKMACATRVDRPVIGTAAQWLQPTPWPGTWWNLNVQLEYWLINATGHTELDSLTRSLDRYRDNLVANTAEQYRSDSAGIGRVTQEDLLSDAFGVPGQVPSGDYGVPEVGNLPWALHDVWMRYRHTMDDSLLRTMLFPLLRRAINYYLHFLTEGADGRLHLPATYSPEYATTRDCNYDLALLTWGCQALLEAAARLKINDPLIPKWHDVLKRLVPPPQGDDGLWIGADVQLTTSHRHFSHMLWFHPLHVLDVTDPANRDLLKRSLAHWLGLPGAQQGYTFTGAASMNALLGDGDSALTNLSTLLTTYVKPNTMYAESGPVMETPLSGAQSLHDMLLQSWGGTLRVFPAIPSGWTDVAMQDLRAEGAFLVTAVRRAGRTAFISIRSLAGEPLRLIPGGMTGPYEVLRNGKAAKWHESGGVLEIELHKGDEALIYPAGTRPDTRVAPVTAAPAPPWGLP